MVKCNKLGYQGAIRFFEAIPGWRDANEKAQACRAAIEEINAKEESQRLEVARQAEIARQEAERKARRNKKIGIIVGSAACVIIGLLILLNTVIIRHNKYKAATALYESRDYEAAISVFEELGSYKDSANAVLECKYGQAIALAGQKDYDTAISIMLELDGYKDSAEKAQSIRTEQLKQAKIGDTILFGSYKHDNEKGNGKEDIEWIILTREDNRLLVISKQALDCKPYNTKHTDVTWETCTLRQWLNSDFLMLLFPRMKRQ